MDIVPVEDLANFDAWLHTEASSAPFTQASLWGDILLSEQEKVERVAVREGENILAEAQITYRDLPFGWQYAFCAGGPVAAKNLESGIWNRELIKVFFDYFKKKKCLFFRFEPFSFSQVLDSKFQIQKVKDINPRATTVLDLSKTEAELLAAMHSKTRYNIRLAEKKGLEIKMDKNVEELFRLMTLTGERDGFRLHYKQHYTAVLNSPMVGQLSAVLDGKVIATLVTVGFGDTLTYLYGASDHRFRSLQAPGLLQWAAIRQAKQAGYRWYDFFGIAPSENIEIRNSKSETNSKYEISDSKFDYHYDLKHQYAGVTRFKLGFGGMTRETAGTHDLILQPIQYRLYQVLRAVRRVIGKV